MPDKIFPYGRGAMLFLILLAPALFLPAQDWLHLLCANGIFVLLILVWLIAAKHFQILEPWTLLARAPKGLRQILYGMLMLLGGWSAIYTAWCTASFLSQTALKLWPIWLAALGLLIICWLIVRHGAPALFRWAIPTAWIVGLVAILSLALSLPDWKMPALSLVLSGSRLFKQILDGSSILLAFLLFTGFDPELPQKRPLLLSGAFAAVLSGLIVFRANAVLGTNCAGLLRYPAYAASGVFQVGALARSEVIFGSILLLCLAAQITLFLCVMHTAYQHLRQMKG